MVAERPAREPTAFERVRRAYCGTAVVALNTALLLLALDALARPLVRRLDRRFEGGMVEEKYGASLRRAYPRRTPDEVRALLSECWGRPPAFEPYTMWKEPEFQGRYVNVHAAGFRFAGGSPVWPPDPAVMNVFVFGGSTTFGYGVADDETIPSYLEEALRPRIPATSVRVYNFARGGYNSTQERVLFEELLAGGRVPALAVFVDGLNDFYFDRPMHSSRMAKLFDDPKVRPEPPLLLALRTTALGELGSRLLGGNVLATNGEGGTIAADERFYDDDGYLRAAIERYVANTRLIRAAAAAFGTRAAFVWQPVPVYDYDLALHPFYSGPMCFERNLYSKFGYPRMAARRAELPADFLWCADLQEGETEPLYVDAVHYAPRLARKIAERIAELLLERGLLAGSK